MPSPRRLSQLDSEGVLGCNYLSVVFVPRCLELLCNVRAVCSCVLVSYANAGACVSALVMCIYIYMYYTLFTYRRDGCFDANRIYKQASNKTRILRLFLPHLHPSPSHFFLDCHSLCTCASHSNVVLCASASSAYLSIILKRYQQPVDIVGVGGVHAIT